MAVVPNFRKFEAWLRLASPPMITWRRRYLSAVACGSSLVLMMGAPDGGLQSHLCLKEVSPLADLVAGR